MGTPKSVNCCFLASEPLSLPSSQFFTVSKWRYDGTLIRLYDTRQSGVYVVRPIDASFIVIGDPSGGSGVVKRFDGNGFQQWESDYKYLNLNDPDGTGVEFRYRRSGILKNGDSFVTGRVNSTDSNQVARYSASGSKSTPAWAATLASPLHGYYVSRWDNSVAASINNPDYDSGSATSDSNPTTLAAVYDADDNQVIAVSNSPAGLGSIYARWDVAPDYRIWGDAGLHDYVACLRSVGGLTPERSYLQMPYGVGAAISSYFFSTPDNNIVYTVQGSPRTTQKLIFTTGFVFQPFAPAVSPWTVSPPSGSAYSLGCCDDGGVLVFIVNNGTYNKFIMLNHTTGATTSTSAGWFRGASVNCMYADGDFIWLGHLRTDVNNLRTGFA